MYNHNRNHNPVLYSFLTYHRNKSNMTGDICGAETSHLSEAP
jgi:hypothetical protein